MKADFARLDGWDELDGWGGEDNLLAWKASEMRMHIVRNKSGIVHRDHSHDTEWHRKRAGMDERVSAAQRSWLARRTNGRADSTTQVPERTRGVSFCVLCKGRRRHLEQTLAANLESISEKNAEIVLVDYGSGDGLAEWVSASFGHALNDGRLQYYQLQENLPFSIPVGKNFAHRLARMEILINLDADNFIGDLWEAAQMLGFNEFLACDEMANGAFGRIGMWRGDFEKLGGYDESFEPVGYYDVDLKERAQRAGLKKVGWACSRPAIQHAKAEIMEFLGGGGREAWLKLERRNKQRSRDKLRKGWLRANTSGFTAANFIRNFGPIVSLASPRWDQPRLTVN
jgi:Glycosyl transferase family 2